MRTSSILLSLTAVGALLGVIGYIHHRRALSAAEQEARDAEGDVALAGKVAAVEVQIPGAWDRKGPKPGWSIWLKDTSATRADLKEACRMTRLVAILLEGRGVTDDWLEGVKGHPYLASVHLSSTSVTDRGLAQLATLPALRLVLLKDSAVTPQGIAALKAALPRSEVDRN